MVFLKLAKHFDLLNYAYAHRGLWQHSNPPENSLAAYKAAAAAGLGLEMDVRPSLDGVPICFHDLSLSRMTQHEGFVSDYTADALAAFKLIGGGVIPLFSDLLAIWPQDLPIIVEMKIDGDTDPRKFTEAVSTQVDQFGGKAAIISFSEEAVSAIPKKMMRGQLVPPSSKIDNFQARYDRAVASDVDFLALNVIDASVSKHATKPTICWTVRDLSERKQVQDLGHAEIFEHLPVPLVAR